MALDLAADEMGEAGAPVVILHGLMGSARNWTSDREAARRDPSGADARSAQPRPLALGGDDELR